MKERKRGRGYERRARTEPRQRMIRPGGFRCCFGVRLGMGSCFCNSRREGERERDTSEKQKHNSVALWTPQSPFLRLGFLVQYKLFQFRLIFT